MNSIDFESLDARAQSDAELLASLCTVAELQDSSDENDTRLWNRFKEAGGDDSHSGGSWSWVKATARQIKEQTP